MKAGRGKPAWHVHSDADPLFSAVKFPEWTSGLTQLTGRQRQVVLERKRILMEWRAARVRASSIADGTRLFLTRLKAQRGVKISAETLYGWERKYRASGEAGLIDGRSARSNQTEEDDPFLAEVRRLWLSKRKPKLTACVEIAGIEARKQGWAQASYARCQRDIARLPRAVVLVFRAAHGQADRAAERGRR
jgi:hypothetical protein